MPTIPSLPITIRSAYADDEQAVWRLAALDSARVPRGSLMLAEVGDELRAAVAVSSLTAIADPFHPTAELVALVRDHIIRTGASTPVPGRRRRALRPALAR